MSEINTVDKNMITDFCTKFPKRYLTVKKYKTLSERDRRFHLFGHWNILHDDGEYIYHSYLNGATGAIQQNYSKLKFSELNGIVFCKWENVFILFRYTWKKGLVPVYTSNKISTFGKITPIHQFYNDNGIRVIKEIVSLDMTTCNAYNRFDAFTREKIES